MYFINRLPTYLVDLNAEKNYTHSQVDQVRVGEALQQVRELHLFPGGSATDVWSRVVGLGFDRRFEVSTLLNSTPSSDVAHANENGGIEIRFDFGKYLEAEASLETPFSLGMRSNFRLERSGLQRSCSIEF